MVLLLLFALVAGAGTALSPCVLPVLPVALSAGATGGRRRPLGVCTGLALSFTFATVALVYVIDALGLPNGLLRTLAIVFLLAFGIALLIPPVGERIEGFLSARFASSSKRRTGEGFWGGVAIGASLGLVYAPCAGPILAGVITVSAAQDFTAGRVAVALAYGIGSALGLYVLMLGGRKLMGRLSASSGHVQQVLGGLMALVAVLMLFNLDTRFQTAVASDLPGFLVNPTKDVEQSKAATKELSQLRRQAGRAHRLKPIAPAHGGSLPVLGNAPEIVGTQRWFNTPNGKKLTLRSLRGRVVLVDFWTYTCINCIRTLPYVKAWDAAYRNKGLTVIGVHTPEFPFEKDAGNVADAVRQNGIHYAVGQDNDMATWNAFGNQFWPAKYLIDARGRVRYTHFGEGGYGKTDRAIRSLLADRGDRDVATRARARVLTPSRTLTTPESYLGAARADRFVQGQLARGPQNFGPLPQLPPDSLAYGGAWIVGADAARAGRGAKLAVAFGARRVYLVLGSPGHSRRIRVLLDGRPIPQRLAGKDVQGGVMTVRRQRLYSLVNLQRVERHLLTLEPEQGIAGYAFTFG